MVPAKIKDLLQAITKSSLVNNIINSRYYGHFKKVNSLFIGPTIQRGPLKYFYGVTYAVQAFELLYDLIKLAHAINPKIGIHNPNIDETGKEAREASSVKKIMTVANHLLKVALDVFRISVFFRNANSFKQLALVYAIEAAVNIVMATIENLINYNDKDYLKDTARIFKKSGFEDKLLSHENGLSFRVDPLGVSGFIRGLNHKLYYTVPDLITRAELAVINGARSFVVDKNDEGLKLETWRPYLNSINSAVIKTGTSFAAKLAQDKIIGAGIALDKI